MVTLVGEFVTIVCNEKSGLAGKAISREGNCRSLHGTPGQVWLRWDDKGVKVGVTGLPLYETVPQGTAQSRARHEVPGKENQQDPSPR